MYFGLGLLLSTGFMAWKAMDVKMTYDFKRIIPKTDEKYIDYINFKKIFGEDGNLMVIGIQSTSLFQKDFFNDWYELGNDINRIKGITGVLSIPHAPVIHKNKSTKSFELIPLVQKKATSQQEVDSLKKAFYNLPFYDGLLFNRMSYATFLGASFNQKELDSKVRLAIVDSIMQLCDQFEQAHDIELKYSGLPYLRSYNTTTISRELTEFLILAMILLAILLYILFKNISAVIFPLIVVVFGAIWSLGTVVLLGYKITILTGLLPTLIVVIGIPNCVYMLNKYHSEFKKHGNKQKALMRMIEKIGHVTLFTNLTTAIGFGVFFFTDVNMLDEFGLVAFLNIIATFIISVIAIPVVFSYLPAPKVKHIVHLDNKILNFFLDRFEIWSSRYKTFVFLIFGVSLILAIIGLSKLQAEGYILDDVSHSSKVYKDLKFFEKNFKGVMPLEISIDSKHKGGTLKSKFLKKLDQAQDTLETYPILSKPISIAEAFKYLMQGFYNGKPKYYRLPTKLELSQNPTLRAYLKNTKVESTITMSSGFIDSNKQIARISVQMADIGSDAMPLFIDDLKPKLEIVFPPDEFEMSITGTSIIAIEGFYYLVTGLVNSVAIAFILISLIMAYLFRSFKMIVMSLIPNIFPLIITAGLMGFLNIPLKPSTVLIFSVAFGISVDYTIHFLAKYKQELQRHSWDVTKVVMVSLRETGVSMLYTSLILFFGFIVFTGSEFEGTNNLGKLTSITLVVAMISNLVLLPAILVALNRRYERKAIKKEALLDVYNEEDDIEFDKLDIKYEKEGDKV
jgi:uncharacterized protein